MVFVPTASLEHERCTAHQLFDGTLLGAIRAVADGVSRDFLQPLKCMTASLTTVFVNWHRLSNKKASYHGRLTKASV